MKKYFFILIIIGITNNAFAENGYDLWLRYRKISNPALLKEYSKQISSIYIQNNSATSNIIQQELVRSLTCMLNKKIEFTKDRRNANVVIIINQQLPKLISNDGFSITTEMNSARKQILIQSKSTIGLLYGTFHLIRLLQTEQHIQILNIVSNPTNNLRILNHWDNLNRHVERGYAGISIFNWHTLPGLIDQRYIDYARANASVGINGTVLTNVNANAMVLTKEYLVKVKALADVFRPYGIKVYLTARFSAPIEIGGLKTADPSNEQVQQWWNNKSKEIYNLIPDFGGFLVKANSEGQPGPQNYGRTHVDGANMLANAVAPFNGIVMWRAFVYSHETPEDRFKQAYNEFKPFDGQFKKNVLVQVKNGPIDFQPREPFHPLFGAMPKTPLMMEFQLTQEYLGQATHLVYEAPMFKEILNADTYTNGKGTTVQKIINGSINQHSLNGMAGVANFGRIAWNSNLTSEEIAKEWTAQTFTNQPKAKKTIENIMLNSYETMVQSMTPLGLHHIMGNGHHYGPLPWGNSLSRADWNPVYYHKANEYGIGFDRTIKGSNALAQYAKEVQTMWADSNSCDEKYLLWFHHVSWNHKMKSGRNLWEELCHEYNNGVASVQKMQQQWNTVKAEIDEERFTHVQQLLQIQYEEAVWWKDACLLYFQTFSKMPIPPQYEQPKHSLDYYKSLNFPYAPGNG
jgi:alpha-glucuronidase